MTAAPPIPIPAYLVAAMRANPADDGLRLQVADWFEENGDEQWAALIRVEVAGFQSGKEPGKWIRAIRYWDLEDFGPGIDGFRARGFLDKIRCTAADWLAHGDAIYAREPVTAVTLTTWPEWESHPDMDRPGPGQPYNASGRIFGRTDWRPVWFRDGDRWNVRATGIDLVRWYLAEEWPSVRKWHLPPSNPRTDELSVREAETMLGRALTDDERYEFVVSASRRVWVHRHLPVEAKARD